ncbi:WD40 repeat-like protein [Jaminaea rosea]|uniref:Pre-mRNA-processing factor 17 n=1 Tax=Jaminaea rosea TaxID=1569628 RepID=A0A316UQD6_9BASI|nr:WD40 repeat-like protein [Jaminaea rosea]PWN27519.1 WD40 repeat-like protein [Jaminaea rosea]
MNSLAGYGSGSDSEGEETPAAGGSSSASVAAAAGKRRRASTPGSSSSDGEGNAAPTDAFGLENGNGTATPSSSAAPSSTMTIRAAPQVVLDDPMASSSRSMIPRSTDTQMHVNVRYDDMVATTAGPSNPFSTRQLGAQQNALNGHYEEEAMSDFDFRNQQKNRDIGHQLAGSSGALARTSKQLKKQRMGKGGDTSVVEGEGAYVGPWGGWEGEKVQLDEGVGPTEEEIAHASSLSTQRAKDKAEAEARRQRDEGRGTEKSIFHGTSMYDYQGRSYLHVPGDVETNLHGEAGSQSCFLPKACVHTFTGHTKGVSALRLFPKSGHLMLSASMDTKIKLWDVYHEGKCLRTYMGHNKAVRDVTFSHDGRQFLSAGYDRQIKLWDTETGQCLRAFSNGKQPNVLRFHPEQPNIFLAGMHDKKIVQFDIDSGEITQEYDQHLGPVNSITFVDENRRFVTTSDDKTMRAWDFDIPVVIKYVADPLMHSMPAVTVHPNGKWLAAQSLDNSVLVYSTDSLRQNRKKIFKGHTVAGYACEVAFSPDGRFVSSGDGEGNVVFWDWKTGRLLKRLPRAHKEVVISHAWLPHETSKVVTGSWDGTIKMWD